MNILILNHQQTRNFSAARLREAARRRGHTARLAAVSELCLLLTPRPAVLLRRRPLPGIDALIPRLGAAGGPLGLAVVAHFEAMGVRSSNGARAIGLAHDKLRTAQILGGAGIPIPSTAFALSREEILPAIEQVGGTPVILKLLHGAQGIGVMLVDSLSQANAIIEALHAADQPVLVQRYIRESAGRDLRVFVIGGRVAAAMRREARPGEFRSNIHRGGIAEGVQPDRLLAELAVRSAALLGLSIAGVDLLEGQDGYLVTEVNASPGLEGIEGATGIDLAAGIIEFVERGAPAS